MTGAPVDRPDGRRDEGDGHLATRVYSGTRALGTGAVSKGLVQLASLVVLSRMLPPEAFGVAAVAAAIVGVADIVRDLGLSQAAIREPTLSAQSRSNLFWANLLLGTAVGAIVAAAAWPLGLLMGIPELPGALWALVPVFLVNGGAAQYRAEFTRTMRFRRLAMADVAAPVLALAVAVLLAHLGFGYWALVLQLIVTALATLVIVTWRAGWRPSRFAPNADLRRHLVFGRDVAFSQVAAYVGANVDTLALGVTASPADVGRYNRAFQLVMAPLSLLRTPSTSVALPTLSRVRDDRTRFQHGLLRAQGFMGYALVPVAAVVAGASDVVVEIALGPTWAGIAPIVAVLALAAALQQLASVASWILLSLGLGRQLRRYSVLSAAVRVVCVAIGAFFGPLGVAVGFVVSVVLVWPVAVVWSCRLGSVDPRPFLAQAGRVLACSSLVAAAAFLTVTALSPAGIVIQALGALCAGLGVVALLSFVPGFSRDIAAVRSFALSVVRRAP